MAGAIASQIERRTDTSGWPDWGVARPTKGAALHRSANHQSAHRNQMLARLPAQPRRNAGTDQQAGDQRQIRDRHGHEREHDLSGPMLAPNPANDAAFRPVAAVARLRGRRDRGRRCAGRIASCRQTSRKRLPIGFLRLAQFPTWSPMNYPKTIGHADLRKVIFQKARLRDIRKDKRCRSPTSIRAALCVVAQ
jgi:hypothetical protein